MSLTCFFFFYSGHIFRMNYSIEVLKHSWWCLRASMSAAVPHQTITSSREASLCHVHHCSSGPRTATLTWNMLKKSFERICEQIRAMQTNINSRLDAYTSHLVDYVILTMQKIYLDFSKMLINLYWYLSGEDKYVLGHSLVTSESGPQWSLKKKLLEKKWKLLERSCMTCCAPT